MLQRRMQAKLTGWPRWTAWAVWCFMAASFHLADVGRVWGAEATRVDDGLQALYTFDSGEGNLVRDRSQREPALDLVIDKPSAVRWGEGALGVRAPVTIASPKPASKIARAIRRSGAVTLEAWVTPANITQSGPARIVSLSPNASKRNFTVGQERDRYHVRFRTTSTTANGTPESDPGRGAAKNQLTHVVYTRDAAGNARIYIDGKRRANKQVGGSVSNWDEQFPLVLANERTGDRPWLGELHLVAIYSKALNEKDVLRNFQAGAKAGMDPRAAEKLALARAERHFSTKVAPLLARHCLECHDTASHKGGLDLSRKAAALAGGESGKVLAPGDVEKSLLWEQIESGDMPPQGAPLGSADRLVLRQWIESGAVWPLEHIDPAVYASNEGASETWVQRLTVAEYIETVRATVGVDIAKEARELLPPDLRADGFSNTAYNLNVDLKHVEAYAQLAQRIVRRMDMLEFAGRFSKSRSLNTDATARKFVEQVGQRLFRGPLDDREVTNFSGILTAVASAGGKYEQGVSLMIEAMLQSPRFIYRIERQRGDGAERRVGEFELASRLSYILWGGPPDEALLKAAQGGSLSNPVECRKQVERMLKDSRARARSQQFVTDWLHLNRLRNMRPNAKRYPAWSAELGEDMRSETLAFFDAVAWQQDRPLADLFNAQFTYATPRLAKHYGLAPVAEGLQRYDLTEVAARGGLLTQGSVLTIGGDDASMVTRGLFVLKDVLRGVIGAPPPGVDTTPVPAKPGLTLRAIAEQRIDNVACGGCHRKFEPLAFGLEQFDGLGAFHLKDEFGNMLRSDGKLLVPGEAEPISYSTSAELMDLIAKSQRVRETTVWKLAQFALGRPLGAADATAIQEIVKESQARGGTYRDTMTAIVMSDLVQQIRTQRERNE